MKEGTKEYRQCDLNGNVQNQETLLRVELGKVAPFGEDGLGGGANHLLFLNLGGNFMGYSLCENSPSCILNDL